MVATTAAKAPIAVRAAKCGPAVLADGGVSGLAVFGEEDSLVAVLAPACLHRNTGSVASPGALLPAALCATSRNEYVRFAGRLLPTASSTGVAMDW